jgi:hypothetical protein
MQTVSKAKTPYNKLMQIKTERHPTADDIIFNAADSKANREKLLFSVFGNYIWHNKVILYSSKM